MQLEAPSANKIKPHPKQPPILHMHMSTLINHLVIRIKIAMNPAIADFQKFL